MEVKNVKRNPDSEKHYAVDGIFLRQDTSFKFVFADMGLLSVNMPGPTLVKYVFVKNISLNHNSPFAQK